MSLKDLGTQLDFWLFINSLYLLVVFYCVWCWLSLVSAMHECSSVDFLPRPPPAERFCHSDWASHFTFCLYSSSIRVPILIFCVFFFYIISHSRRNRFSTMSPPRREILIKLSFPGKGGRWRLCMALWAAWVERVISSLPTLARRTLLEESVLIMSCH